MLFSELLARLDVLRVQGVVDMDVVRVTRDSRQVGVGVVFVAVVGATRDGHDDAAGVAHGVVVVERAIEAQPGVTVVEVRDTRRALAELAAAFAGDPARSMPVVGVTGTNGKTTVTTLCAEAMVRLGRSAGRVGTLGAQWPGTTLDSPLTTPEATDLHAWLARMRADGVEAAFLEVSSAALPRGRADALPFHTVVFTNLSRDHLDLHETMEAYAQAKALLFAPERLRAPGGAPRALLCGDDPAWALMDPPSDRWLYGFGDSNDVRAVDVELDGAGQKIRIVAPDGVSVTVQSPLIGRHNTLNLIAAVAVLATLGVPWSDAALAVGSVVSVRGRMEVVPDRHGRTIVVDYAHTPDALEVVLSTLRECSTGRITVVFGCGGDRDPGKRPVMGAVASAMADRVIVTSDNPRSEDPETIAREIVQGVSRPVEVLLDRAAAIRSAIERAGPGDVVLIAGKGHETQQVLGGRTVAFDDRAVAASILEGA
jgi:UDP-N-acetylmuramoyl-L-alanyl-D-glutamate--2,6-diaminopimelate ligase